MKHTLCTTVSRSTVLAITLLISLLFSRSVEGQTTYTWATAAGSAWLTTSNWSSGVVPTSADVALFNSNATPSTSGAQIGINFSGGAQIVGAISVSSPRTSAITLGSSGGTAGILTLNGSTISISGLSNVILANTCTTLTNPFNISSLAGGTGAMSVSLGNTVTPKIIVTGAGTTTLTGNIIAIGATITTGSNPLTFLGGGTVTLSGGTYNGVNGGILKLSGSNSGMTGAIVVGGTTTNSGILQLDGLNALQGTTNLTINQYSQLFLGITGTYTYGASGTVTLNGVGNNVTTTYGLGALRNSANATFPGAIVMGSDATVYVASGTSLTLSGNMSYASGQFIKRGAGTVILSGTSSTGTGGFTLAEGIANITGAGAFGTGPLSFSPAVVGNTTLSLSAATLGASSLNTVWSGSSITGTQTLNIGTTTSLTITQAASTTSTFGNNPNNVLGTAVITGAGSLIKAGTGTISLSNGGHTFTGKLVLNAGTVLASEDIASTFATGGITTAASTTLSLVNSSTTTLGTINSAGAVSLVNNSGILSAGVITLTAGTVNVSGSATTTLGNIQLPASGTGVATFTNTGGSLAMGNLTVTSGTATITNSTAPITGGNTITIGASGIVTIAPTSSTVSLGSTLLTNSGTLSVAGSATTTLGPLTLVAGTATFGNTGGTLTLGALTASGAAVTLNNSAPLTGSAITVTAGSLNVVSSGATTLGNFVASAGAATFNPTSPYTIGNLAISGGAAVTISGSAAATLSGGQSLSITSGATLLRLNPAAPLVLGSTSVTLGGGTISLSGTAATTLGGAIVSTGSITLSSTASSPLILGNMTLSGGTTTIANAGTVSEIGTGNTITVSGGTLRLAGSGTVTLGTSGVTVSSGGIFLTGTSNATLGSGGIILSGGASSLTTTAGATTIGDLNVSGSATASFAPTSTATVNMRNITVAGSSALTLTSAVTGAISQLGGSNSITITGGVLRLISSGGTYTLGNGGVSISGGTMAIAPVSTAFVSIGGATTVLAGGSLSLNHTGAITLSSVVVSGTSASLITTGSRTLTMGALTVSGSGATVTLAGSGTISQSGAFNLSNGIVTLGGTSLITLGGSNAVSLTGGILNLASSSSSTLAGSIGTTGGVYLNNATIYTSALSNSPVINGGSVTLVGNSTITLGTAGQLKFAASSANVWSGATITVYGWAGTFTGGGATTSGTKLFFGTSASGLGATNLSMIKFDISGTLYDALQLSTGEVVPKATITATISSPAAPYYNDVNQNMVINYVYDGPAAAPGTVYTVEVSNTSGDYSSPVASATSTVSPVSVLIPSLTPVGSYYLRVKAASPTNVYSNEMGISLVGHAPSITSLSSYSGLVPGQTLTITGSGFNATPSLNKVFFGPVAVTPGASSTITSLTVTVPVGATYTNLSVLDGATHLSANSPQKFLPDYISSYFTSGVNFQTPVSFSTTVSFPAATTPWSTAVGDFDGDGDLDIAVVTGNGTPVGYIDFYRNVSANGSTDISTSSFEHVSSTYVGGFRVTTLKIADFDADGRPDIAMGLLNTGQVALLRNTTTSYGTGASTFTFTSSPIFINLGTIYNGQAIEVADFDKDGKQDIAVACFGFPTTNNSKLVILHNNCTQNAAFTTGSFTVSSYTSGNNTAALGTSIAIGDFDNDGDIDIAMLDQSTQASPYIPSTVTMFVNNNSFSGDLNFAYQTTLTADVFSSDIAAGDFDGDGNLDMVVTNTSTNLISIYKNSGAFSIATTPTVTLSGGALNKPGGVSLADMNGDGLIDIIVNTSDITGGTSITTNNIGVYLNNYAGSGISFSSPVLLSNGGSAFSAGVSIADVDKDKYPDIIVANYSEDKFSILRNKPVVNVGSITGVPAALCYNATTTLSYSTTGIGSPYATNPLPSDLTGIWTSSDPTVASINSTTGAVQGLDAGTPNISFTVTVAGTNISGSASTSLSVDRVAISPNTAPNLCIGATTLAIPYDPALGTPTHYSIAYGSTAAGDGFVDVSNAVLASDAITLTVPGTAIAGQSYTLSLTVSDAYCTSIPAIEVPFHSYAPPTASISTANATPCNNHFVEIDFAGTEDATIDYMIDAVPYTDVLTGGALTLSIAHATTNQSYVLVDVQDAHCTNVYNTTLNITPVRLDWVGGVSGHTTDWNQANNWACLTVPSDSDRVFISNITPRPELLSDSVGYAYDITLFSGATLTLNTASLFNVKDSMINDGSVTGAGSVVLNGPAAQIIAGKGSVNNLTLDNASGATILPGARATVQSTLTIAQGNLTTNDSLALASDVNGTARIASIPSGSSVIGRVKTYQYIQAGYRRYRFWAHSFSDTISLGQLQPYMDITGTGGAANGFTTTGTNAPSAYRLDPFTENSSLGYDPGWKPFTKINGTEADTNKLKPGQGIRLFMRGSKGQGLNGYAYSIDENTVAMNGHVNQGTVPITLYKGGPVNMDFNMVGNPYPSPVNIGAALWAASDVNMSGTNNITGAAAYVFNASLGVSGSFQPVDIDGSNYFLQANTCFQVRAKNNLSVLTFSESMKSDTVTAIVFKPSANEHLTLNIYDANYHQWDLWKLRFNAAANDAEDAKYDAVKPSGADFNFYSISADKKKMIIDARPYTANTTIPLGITSPYKQDFIIRADDMKLPEGAAIFLHDNKLKKYVELQPGTEYAFTISADNSSQGDDRFELALKPAEVVAANFNVTMSPNPTSGDVKIAFSSDKKDKVSVRVMDMLGATVYTQDLGNVQSGNTVIGLSNFASGIYMIELTSGDHKSLQKLVKE